jgi:hypothetical protein
MPSRLLGGGGRSPPSAADIAAGNSAVFHFQVI